jgi:hypothetical protein
VEFFLRRPAVMAKGFAFELKAKRVMIRNFVDLISDIGEGSGNSKAGPRMVRHSRTSARNGQLEGETREFEPLPLRRPRKELGTEHIRPEDTPRVSSEVCKCEAKNMIQVVFLPSWLVWP